MIKKVLSITIVIVWCTLIFGYSNQNGDISKGTSDKVVNYIGNIFKIKEESREKLTFPVRKCAHFFVYFVLGFLIINMFKTFDVKTSHAIIISAIFCMIFAGSDELHQLFIRARTAKVSDVLLDSSASLLGIYLYYLLIRGEYEKSI